MEKSPLSIPTPSIETMNDKFVQRFLLLSRLSSQTSITLQKSLMFVYVCNLATLIKCVRSRLFTCSPQLSS